MDIAIPARKLRNASILAYRHKGLLTDDIIADSQRPLSIILFRMGVLMLTNGGDFHPGQSWLTSAPTYKLTIVVLKSVGGLPKTDSIVVYLLPN